MRIGVIHPGATFSTHDVHVGLCWGLRASGHEVIEYRLDRALQISAALIHAAVSLEAIDDPVDVFGLASAEAMATMIHYEPDAVIVVSGGNFPLSRVAGLTRLSAQRRIPFPVVLYDTESPYVTPAMARAAQAYNVVLTNERLAVGRYQHDAAYYLPHAFHPNIHAPAPADPALATDAVFIGTAFPERIALFRGADWAGVDFRCMGALWDVEGAHADQTISPEGVIDNADTARWYHSTKIAINHHRTSRVYGSAEHIEAVEAASLGPRAYEIAACGAFQLCDDSRRELFDIFGDSVPTYRLGDADDLARQVRHWLDRPGERAERAAEAYQRVQSHRWDRRAADVLTYLEAARDDLKSRHRRRRKRALIQPQSALVRHD